MKDGKFEVGDLVYLKSGSQKMVVNDTTSFTARDEVGVMWMHFDTQTLRDGVIPAAALELAADKGSR